jgi:hypothetical protein
MSQQAQRAGGGVVPNPLATSVLDKVGGQQHTLAALLPGKIRYPLYRRWPDCNSVVLVIYHVAAWTRNMHCCMGGQLDKHWELLFGKQLRQEPFIIEQCSHILWLLISTHPTKIGLFHLVMNLISLENLLKCDSLSVFCACKLQNIQIRFIPTYCTVYTTYKLLQHVLVTKIAILQGVYTKVMYTP